MRFWIVSVLCLLGLLAGFAPAARAQATYPARPQEGVFIADEANLIDPADKAKIRSTCEQLQSTKGTPLMVATITSMADHNASGWQIERYAMNLFDEWGIGHTDTRNSGILLLVSKNDRKVRIELGQSWSHDRDAAAASIVNNTIVPQFKAGHFSAGIREGVDALAKTLGAPAGASSPSSPANSGPVGQPRGFVPSAPLHSTGMSTLLGPIACIVIPIVFIVIISIVSRIGRGIGGGGYGGGYGPVGWGGGWGGGGGGFLSGAILGGLLGNAWGSRRGSGGYGGGSSGGGFGGGGGFSGGGGGSFGGGFSGGGGATGSW